MRLNIINNVKKTVVFAFLAIVATGCSNDDVIKNENKSIASRENIITATDLEFVGVEHNAYLEVVYNALVESDVSDETSIDVMKNAIIGEIENSESSEEGKNLAIELVENYDPADFDNTINNFYQDPFVASALSSDEKIYLDRLYLIVNDSTSEVSNRISRIAELEEEIGLVDFSDKQFITLYSATNVAKYSLSYWFENISKWDNLDNNGVGSKEIFNWGDIAGADVDGAINGAVIAVGVNAAPGAGQVAYGSAIIGTAATYSAGEGIRQWVSSWFD